jgi:hypothetical protein
LNLKCIKFNQIHLEKYFWKLKNNALLYLSQAAQPAHSFCEAQREAGLTRMRARPAKARLMRD